MASYNRTLLMGNLTRNPDIRYTPSGAAVCDLGLAVNETFTNKAGETIDKTCFVDVTVWGKQAESCSQYLKKGSPVFVEGRLELDQWEKDGEKRSKLRVRADRVQFLSGKPGEEKVTPDANAAPEVPEGDDDLPF
jgi:single-strand DNA-binding protein